MDPATLQILIDRGYSIGFHGHQHRPEFIDESYRFGTGHKITVVSAASLCAGPDDIPPGHSRGYNLLELDVDKLKGKLHQRKMLNDSFASPIWGPGQFPWSMKSFVEFRSSPLATSPLMQVPQQPFREPKN